LNPKIIKYESQYLSIIHKMWNNIISNENCFFWDKEFQIEEINSIINSQTCTYLAIDADQAIGFYILHPNNNGKGSHIGNALYAVAPSSRGKGIGSLLCEHSLIEAKRHGFKAMIFNSVLKNNQFSNRIWKKNGFKVIGEVPNAYKIKKSNYANTLIYYKEL